MNRRALQLSLVNAFHAHLIDKIIDARISAGVEEFERQLRFGPPVKVESAGKPCEMSAWYRMTENA